jgi:hypothetical protein
LKVKERRALLETHANPDSALDYVSGLHGTLQAFGLGKPTLLSIHYVPDRMIIDPAAFGRYLEALSALEWDSLEQLATEVLGDFNDHLIGRWVRVVVTAPEGAYPGVGSHEVLIEDRQPGWDNPSLLSRLA